MASRSKSVRLLWSYVPLLLIVIVVVVRLFFCFVYRIPSPSTTSHREGSLLILYKQASPQRGGYALVKTGADPNNKPQLLRVVALPGEAFVESSEGGILPPYTYAMKVDTGIVCRPFLVHHTQIVAVAP